MLRAHRRPTLKLIKAMFNSGDPQKKAWALAQLKLRWTQTDRDWERIKNYFKPSPYPGQLRWPPY